MTQSGQAKLFAMPRNHFLIFLLSVAIAGCGEKKITHAPPVVKNVLVTSVRVMDVPVQLHEFGRLSSPQSVNVQPQVSGRIMEVHFVDGQEVKKGDLLFVIDPRPFQADLGQSQGQLKSDQAQLDLDQRNLQRDQQTGPGRFVSAQQIDTDRAQVENFQGAVAKDQASVDLAKLNLEYCYVRSPNDGRTGRRLVDPGNYVATGGATLVNIQLQDPVYVDFTISENDLAQLRANLGQGNILRVDVITPAKPDIVKTGKLTFLDSSVSTQSGTAFLRATIPNQDRYLWPGQYVNVTLTLQILKSSSVVPLVSITLTPMMCSRILGPRGEGNRTWMERTVGDFFKTVTAGYGRTLYFFLHHRWISAFTWAVCFVLTVWVFGLLPKTFIPAGDSGFIRGLILCQEGISPDRIKVLQKEVDAILRENPAVDETFTLAGFSQGLPSNQMLALAFLKAVSERPPIT
jgi:membrane fusion protein, multidrug efflux system